MSIAPILRELIAAGLSGDALCAAVERIEASRLPVRSSNAERQQRYRDRKSGIDPVTHNVTDVTDVTLVSLGSDGSPKIISNPSFPPQPSPLVSAGASVANPAKPKIEIPDWVPAEQWAGFVAMRRASKAAFTVNAARLIIVELGKLKDAGQPPGDVLDQSTRNGWRDVFEIKGKTNERSMGRNDRPTPPTIARGNFGAAQRLGERHGTRAAAG